MHRPDIKAGLLLAGYNQATIAQKLGCTPSCISRIISGDGISARIAEGIAAVQGKTAADLWPGVYTSPKPLRRQRAA